VFLLVNKTIDRLPERFGTDKSIVSLILPAIVREILWRICIYEKFDPADEQEGWKANWIRFAKTFNSGIPRDEDDDDQKSETIDWIESVVDRYCKKVDFKQLYSRHLEGEST
jgi:hypothetical protein